MTIDAGRSAHPKPEELLDYFEAKLSEARELAVEDHLAACDDCAIVGREVYAFQRAWDTPARAHGELYLGERLAEALGRAAADAESEALRRRLAGWARRWSGRAEAVLQVITELSEQTHRAVGRAVDGLGRPGTAWHFEPELAAAPVRGAAAEGPASSVLSTAVTPGKPRARVSVSAAERGEIVVRLDELARDEPAPLILLIAVGGALTVRVAEATRQPAVDYRIARFTDVTPGEYLVAFEPLDRRDREE